MGLIPPSKQTHGVKTNPDLSLFGLIMHIRTTCEATLYTKFAGTIYDMWLFLQGLMNKLIVICVYDLPAIAVPFGS